MGHVSSLPSDFLRLLWRCCVYRCDPRRRTKISRQFGCRDPRAYMFHARRRNWLVILMFRLASAVADQQFAR